MVADEKAVKQSLRDGNSTAFQRFQLELEIKLPLILLGLFVLIPIFEIATFIQVGSVIGLPLTLLGILITAVIGAVLVRAQGFKVWNDARTNLESNKSPVEQVIHGVFILIAGLLLLTPGFLTDAIGFIFLVPPLRLLIATKIWKWMKNNASIHVETAGQSNWEPKQGKHGAGQTIDVEAIEIEVKDVRSDPDSPWKNDK